MSTTVGIPVRGGFTPEKRELGPTTLDPAGSIVGTVTDAATAGRSRGRRSVAQSLGVRKHIGSGGWGDATTDDGAGSRSAGFRRVSTTCCSWRARGRPAMTATAVEGVRVQVGEDTSVDMKAVEGRRLRGGDRSPRDEAPAPAS